MAMPMDKQMIGLGLRQRIDALTKHTWGAIDGQILAPHSVEIQPTAHCHRTCSFCSHIIRNRRGGTITEPELRELLAEFADLGVQHVGFSGGGEPLYWSGGRLAEMIELAAGFATVSLTSSGDQLWDAEHERLHLDAFVVLRECSATYLNIPAVDELSFHKQVRGPSGWSHTSAMLRALIKTRESDRATFKCEVHAVVVISASNVDRVAEIDRVLTEHGVDAIYYKQWKNFENRNVRRLRLEDEHILERLSTIPEQTRSRDLVKFIGALRTPLPSQPCWANRIGYDAIIDPDGEIYLCTPTVGKAEFSIGNLDDGGFTACWTGAVRAGRIRELSGLSSDGACPSECRHHTFNAQVDARLKRG
jgi:radical SAM protein with 4Fe4S-binding SPASM domain